MASQPTDVDVLAGRARELAAVTIQHRHQAMACAAERRALVQELRARGLTWREIGGLLGITAARASNLAKHH